MRRRTRRHMLSSFSRALQSYAALGGDETMADADSDPTPVTPAPARWLPWLAAGWVLLLVLTAVAELGGFDDLRLALDFQRHFR